MGRISALTSPLGTVCADEDSDMDMSNGVDKIRRRYWLLVVVGLVVFRNPVNGVYPLRRKERDGWTLVGDDATFNKLSEIRRQNPWMVVDVSSCIGFFVFPSTYV